MSGDEQFWAEGLLDEQDGQLLAEIRSAFEVADPTPPGLVERITFAMTVAGLEAELAELIAEPVGAGTVRTTAYERASTITFESSGLSVMVTISPADHQQWTVRGWLSVPSAEVELRERHRSHTASTDAEGRFVFDGLQGGTVHLVIRRLDDPDARPVITPGIEL